MQVLTIMDTTIIWCYYHVSTVDENVNYIKLTHLFVVFIFSTPRGSLMYIYLLLQNSQIL
jgi:hypothetical protein